MKSNNFKQNNKKEKNWESNLNNKLKDLLIIFINKKITIKIMSNKINSHMDSR